MKQRLFLLAWTLCTLCPLAAQRITRSYHRVPLPQVLADLERASRRYTINFIYDELEDFTVTVQLRGRTIPEAVREVLGFYPMRLTMGDSLIFVECTQKEGFKAMGRVVDTQGIPVAYANVALLNPSDSSLMASGVSNEGGDFVVPCHCRRALLRVSFVGYRTLWRTVDVGPLGTLRLTPDSYTLQKVNVKGMRRVVRSEVDRLQYLVANDPYALGMNGIEVMSRVPMLCVNDETVSVVGKGATHFMLDGRVLEMSDEGIRAKLRSLKAEDIERIEVMTIPPAKYKAEANGGYVNIVMRRDQTRGWSGSLTSCVQRQYRSRLIPEANASYVSRKIEMSASVSADIGHVYNHQRSVFTFDDGRRRTSDRTSETYWPLADASSIVKFLPTQRLEIGAMASVHIDRTRGRQTDLTIETDSTRSTADKPAVWNHSVSTTLYADWRLDSLGKTASLNYNFFGSSDPYRSENTSVSSDRRAEELRSSSRARYRIHALKLDFELPFKALHVETGAAYTHISNRSGIVVENRTAGQWITNTNESNDFGYSEHSAASYFSARRDLGKRLRAQAGLRYEYTWTHGRQHTTGQTNSNHYSRLFPTLHLSWQPHEGHVVGLAVNCGIGRPNFNDLNPFRSYTTVTNYVTGNPQLTAAYTRNAELNYNNGRGLYLVLYNDHGSNETGWNVAFGTDGTQVGSPVNGVRHDKSGLYSTYNRNLLSWLNVQAEAEVYYHNAHADALSNLQSMHGWGRRVGGTLALMLNAQKTLVASVTCHHDFSAYWQTNRTGPLTRLYWALTYSCMDNRLKLRLAGGDPFRWNVTHTTARYIGFTAQNSLDVHARYLSLRATWSFGGRHIKKVYHDNRDTETHRAGK